MLKTSYGSPDFKNTPCAVTIGVFDGMHPGHELIIRTCVAEARRAGITSVVITFSKNPKMAAGTQRELPPLISERELDEKLADMGVDVHCVIDFSGDMSKLSGREFIAGLCMLYKLRAIVIGSSFRCGSTGESAGPAEIKQLLSLYAPSAFIKVVPSVSFNGEEVSSSLIRRWLLTGNMEKVSMLLGRAYGLDLRGLSFRYGSGCLLYDTRASVQLLPKAGTYRVKAAGKAEDAPTSEPTECDGSLVISEDCLALNLSARIIPDRLYFL